jgi:hypothetical protein
MSINSGQCYKITNEQAKLVVDLSGTNNKSVIGWESHGGTNQQVITFNINISITCTSYDHNTIKWILQKQDDGQWTIQSVRSQQYLGFENIPGNGSPLVAVDKPQTWDIVIVNNDDPAKTSVKYVLSRPPH